MGEDEKGSHSHLTVKIKSHLPQEANCESWQMYKIIGIYVHDLGVCTIKEKTDTFNYIKI